MKPTQRTLLDTIFGAVFFGGLIALVYFVGFWVEGAA